MGDKYSDLPGIEEGPQVFETSDVEDMDTGIVVAGSHDQDSDIDESSTKVESAAVRFHRDVIEDRDDRGKADFLGNAGLKLGLSGYRVRTDDETVDERLARIARELEELKVDVEGRKQGEQVDVLAKMLQERQNLRDGSSLTKTTDPYSERIAELFRSAPIQRVKETRERRDTKQASRSITGVLELEARISRIETVVGTDSGTGDSKLSFQGQIDELTRKANLVYNPEYHVKSVSEKVRKLNESVEKHLSNRRLAVLGNETNDETEDGGPSSSSKVEAVYSRLADFDRMNAMLPGLLSRLKSLSAVHNELGGCVTTISELDKTLGELLDDISKWDTSLSRVFAKLEQQEKQFDTNKHEVEEWVRDLEAKFV